MAKQAAGNHTPKSLRQRSNRKAGAAELEAPESPKVPVLPKHIDRPSGKGWHRHTRRWWRHVWESPMAGEYLESDVDGLIRLAILIDQFNWTNDPKLMSEIRLQEARFGLSPVDRSRLQWEVARSDEATSRRRAPATTSRSVDDRDDPRNVLRAVK